MTKTYCDICGQEITSYKDVSVFKLKKLEASFGEAWWDRLTVHSTCWRNLCKMITKRRKEHANV